MRILRSLIFVLIAAVALCAQAAPVVPVTVAPTAHPTLVFMTDFGRLDDAVAICRAVMQSVDPGLRIEDITHDVTPFDIAQGARLLAGAAPYYASNAVFVVVVDPTVGSARKAIIAKSGKGQFFVVPDNGLLTFIAARDGIVEAHEITNVDWLIGAKFSSTFHGRDIFSPVGAHLTRGDDWTTVGPKLDVTKLVKLENVSAIADDKGVRGAVIALDGPFGNIVTNITRDQAYALGYKLGDVIHATIDGKPYDLPFVKTFSDVPVGSPLFYIDSRGRLGLAVNQNSFAKGYGVHPPAVIIVDKKR